MGGPPVLKRVVVRLSTPVLSNTHSFPQMKTLAHPVAMGALTQLRAGTTPEAEEWNGKVRTT